MGKTIKSLLLVMSSAAALSLAACTTPVTVSFDTVKPWMESNKINCYEKLDYTVAVYDVTNGAGADKRIKIADGAFFSEIDANARTEGSVGYSMLNLGFEITYNDKAGDNAGKTHSMTSETEFANDSLATVTSKKTMTAAEKYTIESDYFEEHKSVVKLNDKEYTVSIPSGTYCDNEMMFLLARATPLAVSAGPNFKMTAMFDSAVSGKFIEHTMVASCDKNMTVIDLGEWTEKFGVERVTAEDGTVSHPMNCYNVGIMINSEEHGPPYYVCYTEKPFVSGEKSHSKIPLTITYTTYRGNRAQATYEYTLTGCSFDKPAN